MNHRSDFVDRHIGPNQYQIQTMLLELGFKDLDSFISSVVPQNIHIKGEIEKSIPAGISEVAALAEIKEIGEDKFKREILKLCFSKKQLTYYEIAYQCKYDVLETNSYNDNIMSRIFRKDLHLPD